MNKKFHKLIEEASLVILDKEQEIRLAVTCLLAGGHLLIEDLPGVGKTTLVQTLGKLLGLKTKRIQFTIDLLPADILGGQIFNPQEQKFIFHPGPLFSQIVMADELNRASPRTQGALLQAMEESEVSIDGITWPLPRPFFLIATQNPHQQSGTFPLPESQLDRFLMSLELHHASKKTESQIFQGEDPKQKLAQIKPLFTENEIFEALGIIENIKLSPTVAEYIAELLMRSRQPGFEGLALSTRAGMALVRSAKAWAFMEGRNYVRPEDIQAILVPALGHRLGGNLGLKKGRQLALALQQNTPIPL
jgi:MoxR-like ATPase